MYSRKTFIFSHTDLDYFPNCDQFGSLPEASQTQYCVPFSAIYDDVAEDDEEFTVSLQNPNRQISGTGAITVDSNRDLVTITILNATSPLPPEGISTTYLNVEPTTTLILLW